MPCTETEINLNAQTLTADITSPNYPSPYPNRVCYEWVITVPSGQKLQCEFVGTFSIETSTE